MRDVRSLPRNALRATGPSRRSTSWPAWYSNATVPAVPTGIELEAPEALDRRYPYYDPISSLGEVRQKWWADQS